MTADNLTDLGAVKLWTAVIRQAAKDACGNNGRRQEARRWLQAPTGAEAVLIGLGCTRARAWRSVTHGSLNNSAGLALIWDGTHGFHFLRN